MTTANEHDLQGKCSDLRIALDAERICNRNHLAHIARLNALTRTLTSEREAAEMTIRRLTAEIEELRAGVMDGLPY